ncbi:hypothetical protein D3C74_352640 [compost metagenome]
MGKVHTKYSITRFQRCKIYCHVRLCAGVRLNIHVFCSEQFFGTITRNVFNYVHMLTTAIVTFTWIAFSVLVGQYRSQCFDYCFTHDVLGCNQFDVVLLTFQFKIHRFQYCRVIFTQLFHD